VFGCLGHEAETGLVGVELQDSTEGLLGDLREIVGIVHQNPCNRVCHGSNPTNEFRKTLTDRRNSAIVGRT
jgi:hypothetical protein